ncbi:molybdate ABC transporter substrate-binding protein (plasmid) [Cereibacter azotoformans]|uniref:molybdate ABC transporter substrate-binding protein n=1 Tax=Cereibacter azotoformans TaxID=43057 RepID=UPI001EEC4E6C|nr:molybdate ABC transporter substrate-binding protein [Cereibacter azotoformans]ULB12452.1 molybdate ABC transporter substrate-binding protein [Cereibacter azotoformans]
MIHRRHSLCAIALLGWAMLAGLPATAQGDAPVIAAAADLQFAITEIAESFKAETGHEVRITTGSTGNAARQIREGAPFQMFLAADEQFIFDLARDGLTRDEGTLYAIGRIVMVVPKGSALKADGSLASLKAALEAGQITKFAIANPEHAPYGTRAMEALQREGLWDALQPHIVLGENVSQTAQFVLSGNATAGIIALSLAKAPNIVAQGEFGLIPDEWHEPLRQRMVLLKNAGPVAEAFYAYMTQPAARAVMERYGFVLPEE